MMLPRPWAQWEEDFLSEMWASPVETEVIRETFPDRSQNALVKRAFELGIKRHPLAGEGGLPKDLQLAPTDAAYLAGFLDGEGTITLVHRKDRNQVVPLVLFTNTNLAVLQWVRDRVGGNIKGLSQNRKENPKWKPAYKVELMGKKRVMPLLKALLPHLRIKKPQAELLLTHCENRLVRTVQNTPHGESSLRIRAELQHLNRRGPN